MKTWAKLAGPSIRSGKMKNDKAKEKSVGILPPQSDQMQERTDGVRASQWRAMDMQSTFYRWEKLKLPLLSYFLCASLTILFGAALFLLFFAFPG